MEVSVCIQITARSPSLGLGDSCNVNDDDFCLEGVIDTKQTF